MIVVLGSINLDLIFAAPHLPVAGETVLCEAALTVPGGKGANQALAARRDGAAVRMAGAVGHDAFAAPALALLREGGVDLTAVVTVEQLTGIASVMVDAAGHNRIVVASGANLSVRADQVPDAWLGPGTTLVLQMEIPATETTAAIERARRRGARIVLNLAPVAALPESALRQVDVLIGNEIEIGSLAAGDPVAATEALAQRLGIDVITTCGKDGAVLAGRGACQRIGAMPIPAVDTTGAGDTFVGVFAAALDRGLAGRAALHRASVAAGLACTRHGAQSALPSQHEIDTALPRLAPAQPLHR